MLGHGEAVPTHPSRPGGERCHYEQKFVAKADYPCSAGRMWTTKHPSVCQADALESDLRVVMNADGRTCRVCWEGLPHAQGS
jgi:hypothetical protein